MILQVNLTASNTAQQALILAPPPRQTSGQYVVATVYGISGFNISGLPVNNQQLLYFGYTSGQYPGSVATGSFTNLTFPDSHRRESLSNLWFWGVQNDGAYIVYY